MFNPVDMEKIYNDDVLLLMRDVIKYSIEIVALSGRGKYDKDKKSLECVIKAPTNFFTLQEPIQEGLINQVKMWYEAAFNKVEITADRETNKMKVIFYSC